MEPERFRQQLGEIWKGEIFWNRSLAPLTTMGVGGSARAVIEPGSGEQLSLLLKGLRNADIPWYVIGRGSNIIVPDQGVDGVALLFGSKLARIRQQGEDNDQVLVRVEAGCGLGRLLNWTAERELSGLEFAAGIPGSVGGAVIMNAGAHGGEIGPLIRSLTLVDEESVLRTHIPAPGEFSYRTWDGPKNALIVSALFALRRGKKKEIDVQCRNLLAARKNRQPKGASAGSVFKNPPGDYAGRLIEAAGFKGVRQGGAQVSPRHANFIVNTGTATAEDVLSLIELIRDRVEEKFGIRLFPEIQVLGEQNRHM